nr:type I restriction enzyme endonuclease domain-containing protein [Hydrogenophilus thermoluteolus]
MALSLLLDTTQGCTSFVGRTSQTGVLRTFTIGADRAQLRVLVKRILRKYGYPPDKQEQATELVLEQTEVLCEDWVTAA